MEFLSYLINGISLGSIYAIIALGYTMVYGIAKMLNFAHGDVIMVGGYVAFYAMQWSSASVLGEAPSAMAWGVSTLVCVCLLYTSPSCSPGCCPSCRCCSSAGSSTGGCRRPWAAETA